MFLVILAQSAATSRAYAVKYRERFVENDDLRRPERREPRRRPQQHVRRQRQPDEDRDGRRGEEPHPGRAADDGGRRGDRAAVPDEAAAVPAERRALGGRLPDRHQARSTSPNMREIWRLRKDEFCGRRADRGRRGRASASSRASSSRSCSRSILHVRRHYTPRDRVVGWDAAGRSGRCRPTPGHASRSPGSSSTASASASSTRTPSVSPRRCSGSSTCPSPPRWFVLDADAIDDVDYTGGKTLAGAGRAARAARRHRSRSRSPPAVPA